MGGIFGRLKDWWSGPPPRTFPDPLDELRLKSKRILDAIDNIAQTIPTEGGLNDAEEAGDSAVEYLRRWLEGSPPFLPKAGQIRREYVQELWLLIGKLRQARMYCPAIQIWALLAATTDETNSEVVFLAADLAREYGESPPLRRPPLRLWVFSIVLEAMSVTLSELPSNVNREFDKLFSFLRIDWDQPPAEQIPARAQVIDQVLPLASTFPNEYGKRLPFWRARGEWRMRANEEWMSQECRPSETLLAGFESLIARAPDGEAEFEKAFRFLRIEWDQPHLAHVARSVEWLRHVLSRDFVFSSSGRHHLVFWETLGEWKLHEGEPPMYLLEKFRWLTRESGDDPEGQVLFCWCAQRLRYESAGDPTSAIQADQVAAIADERHRFNGMAPLMKDHAKSLATYFQALTWSERALGWRRGELQLRRRDVSALDAVLTNVPRIVQMHERLNDHIAPVVRAIGSNANKIRAASVKRGGEHAGD